MAKHGTTRCFLQPWIFPGPQPPVILGTCDDPQDTRVFVDFLTQVISQWVAVKCEMRTGGLGGEATTEMRIGC